MAAEIIQIDTQDFTSQTYGGQDTNLISTFDLSTSFTTSSYIESFIYDNNRNIITFDYTEGLKINSDIFISINRVEENAKKFKVSFEEELHRVMIHGVLHLCGYKDKSKSDTELMRKKENWALNLKCY